MNLASPKSDDEYRKLRDLLSSLDIPMTAAIALYRSATDKKVWLDGNGEKANFFVQWYDDVTWSPSTDENCAAYLPLDDSPMTDISCGKSFAFVCEKQGFDIDLQPSFAYDPNEAKQFMGVRSNVVGDTKSYEFSLGKSSIKLSFFDAKLLCWSLQMDLFTPDPALDDGSLKNILRSSEAGSMFLTGMTSMGASGSWYSTIDGRTMNDAKWTENLEGGECSVLVLGSDGAIYYDDVSCTDEFNFICQKVTDLDFLKYEYSDDVGDDVELIS